jgi:hypothetical protein
LNEFNAFLNTGNRTYLHLPNLSVGNGGSDLNVRQQMPQMQQNNLTVNNITVNNQPTIVQPSARPNDAQVSVAMNRLQDFNHRRFSTNKTETAARQARSSRNAHSDDGQKISTKKTNIKTKKLECQFEFSSMNDENFIEKIYFDKTDRLLYSHRGWFLSVKELLPSNFRNVLAQAYKDAHRSGKGVCPACKRPYRYNIHPSKGLLGDITFDINGRGDPYWAIICNSCTLAEEKRPSRNGKPSNECISTFFRDSHNAILS